MDPIYYQFYFFEIRSDLSWHSRARCGSSLSSGWDANPIFFCRFGSAILRLRIQLNVQLVSYTKTFCGWIEIKNWIRAYFLSLCCILIWKTYCNINLKKNESDHPGKKPGSSLITFAYFYPSILIDGNNSFLSLKKERNSWD